MASKFGTLITLLVMFYLILVLPPQAKGEWWLTVGEEDLLLIRTDENPDEELHDLTHGTYGYWGFFDGTVYWWDVMYINSPPCILPPFDPGDLAWIPGPLDVEEDDGPDMGPGRDGGDDDEWREGWNQRVRNHGGDCLPDGWENWSAQDWTNWYADNEEEFGGRGDNRGGNNRLSNLWRHFPQWWDQHGGGR